jgi:membrane protein implicated in regulation of membrane protease activity
MQWWAWVVAGAVLLGAELGLVNAEFYLVFIGAAAMAVGAISLLLPSLGGWPQWAIFAVLAVASMLAFRSRLYARLNRHAPAADAGVGGVLTVPEFLPPGETCQAEHGGSYWTVRNDGATGIAPGGRVRIVRRDGLTLTVRPENKPAEEALKAP